MSKPRGHEIELREVTVSHTAPCDASGPTVEYLADCLALPFQIRRAMQIRSENGVKVYGTELRAPWKPGTREAWQEILDALAYLIASGDGDDALFAVRLAGQADAWARKRGIYTGQHDG